MKTIEEIKDEVAIEKGYTSYNAYAFTDEGKEPSHQDDFDFHLSMLDEVAQRFADQQASIAVEKVNNAILLQESHGWNGLAYEQGYQKAIEDINLLVLSLAPQILEELKGGEGES